MSKHIAMLAFPDAQCVDIAGPLEVFALASRQAQEQDPTAPPLYRISLVAAVMQPLHMASGLSMLPNLSCDELIEAPDTLLVSGGMGDALDRARDDPRLLAWLRQMAARCRRVGSICNGALLLAHAGLLDGRRATTHWSDVAELRRRYPQIQVVADAIYTEDEAVWTSAGITAGMDLALAMVAADHGQALALQVAKRMVMVSKRSGGQSQFSRQLLELALPDRFAALAQWIRENLSLRLDTDMLAGRVAMSPRQFNRRFRSEFGSSPMHYIRLLRIEAAKPMLESSAKDLKRIAHDCGFASEDAMRRAFLSELGVAPSSYRANFGV